MIASVSGLGVAGVDTPLARGGEPGWKGFVAPSELMVIVVTRLSYGCPIQAIVQAYGWDERTVARWRDRAGRHGEQIHPALIEQGNLDLVPGQADEIRVKGRKLIAWMGLAMLVSTRLWLGGVVSLTRDTTLADRLLHQVRACSQSACAVLICSAGWAAYPGSIRRGFREKVKKTLAGARAGLERWPARCSATVIKRAEKNRVVEITRKMTVGTLDQAKRLLQASRGGEVLTTAFSERFKGTMRERLASLTRQSRPAAQRICTLSTGMDLIGCTYNLCFPQHEVSTSKHVGHPCTAARAAGLTAHVWTLRDLLLYQGAPAPWVEPKRAGRPRQPPLPDPTVPKRARGRPPQIA